MTNWAEKGILVIFLWILFIGSFSTSCARFSEFYAGNVILFQIKVNARNIKEINLARYFIKVTARPSFTRLRVIKWIEFIKYESRKCVTRFSCISFLFKPSWLNLNKQIPAEMAAAFYFTPFSHLVLYRKVSKIFFNEWCRILIFFHKDSLIWKDHCQIFFNQQLLDSS